MATDAGFEVVGFVENVDRTKAGTTLRGFPIYWIDEIGELTVSHQMVCGLGTTLRTHFIKQGQDAGFSFATVVHPTARVSTTATLGPGSVVNAGALIAAHVIVHPHVYVNRGALIGHHTEIGSFSSIMPGANIGGNATIGGGVYAGMGSIVLDRITVGDGTIVGAGAVVTKDLPAGVLAVGVPARIAKEEVEGI